MIFGDPAQMERQPQICVWDSAPRPQALTHGRRSKSQDRTHIHTGMQARTENSIVSHTKLVEGVGGFLARVFTFSKYAAILSHRLHLLIFIYLLATTYSQATY